MDDLLGVNENVSQYQVPAHALPASKPNTNRSHSNQKASSLAHAGVVYPQLDAAGRDAVLHKFASGARFRDIAIEYKVPTLALWQWIKSTPDNYRAYNDAMEARAHFVVDEAQDLADRVADGIMDPKQADMKVKLSQWIAGKTRPYADKQVTESHNTVDITIRKMDDGDLSSRLDQLLSVSTQRALEHWKTTE